jgi:hypothetical protein
MKSGRKVSLKNLTFGTVNSMAGREGFKMHFDVTISEFFDEDRSLVTIAHESFLHVEPKVNEFGNVINRLFTGEFDGGEKGLMEFTNALNAIGNLEREHKLAVDGKAVTMENFIKEIVTISGNENVKNIFERWKEAEKVRK